MGKNRSISKIITNIGSWNIVKVENEEGWLSTEKSWLQEAKGTQPGTNHTVLSDVCVCVRVSCLSGSWFFLDHWGCTEGRGGRAKELRDGGVGGATKSCWPLLSVPPTYFSVMGMLPGAFTLKSDGNQSALSSTPNCKKTWDGTSG